MTAHRRSVDSFNRSAQSMASTLANVGRQRAPQEVRILTKEYGGPLGPRYVVFVCGDYYRVLEPTLWQLQMGVPVAELELEIADPDADPEED